MYISGMGQTSSAPCSYSSSGYAPGVVSPAFENILNLPSDLLLTLMPSLTSGGGFAAIPIIAIAGIVGWGLVAYLLLGRDR